MPEARLQVTGPVWTRLRSVFRSSRPAEESRNGGWNVNLLRRLAALERQLISEPVLLTMPDGQTATIPGHGIYLVKLLSDAVRGINISAEQAAELDLIRRSTDAIEPGGGRLVELIRLFLHGPAETT
jgi:hypothetical protein